MSNDESALLSSFFEVIGRYPFNDIIGWALRFCFRNPYESITIVDKSGRVQFMDNPTEEFFGFKQGEAAGMDMRDLVPHTNIPLTIATGKPQIGKIWEGKGLRRISSVYPLIKNGEIIGAVGKILFHSLEEIERINEEIQRLNKEIHYLKQKEKTEYRSLYTFNNILGNSVAIRGAIEISKKIAPLDTDVLIVGESGTGKELFAHSIHSLAHPDRPFIKINCPAIPFELAESQLFGYEKGAFTGATTVGKPGAFETAEGGTVFLDEISSLPLSIQAKLLRVLQEREVTRLGSSKTKKINFRSIAATNIDLRKLVKEGRFRHDLYYRVAKATVTIPPLRERREDIPLYLNSFLEMINWSFKTSIRGFSREAFQTLIQYDWPGNVRELINVLEQVAIRAITDEEISIEALPEDVRLLKKELVGKGINTSNAISIKQHMMRVERDVIISALKGTGGNRQKAARLLKMPRSSFYKKLAAYNIYNDSLVS